MGLYDSIAGQGEGFIQTAGTSEAPAAVHRTQDRLDWERSQAAMQPKPTTEHPWIAEAKAEAAKKAKDEKDAIARGAVKILPDGTRVEYFSGNRRL